jgi:hypothetical protein
MNNLANAPDLFMWYSVETPQVFVEHKLPVEDQYMSATHKRRYQQLLDLAEQHGTTIRVSRQRRG